MYTCAALIFLLVSQVEVGGFTAHHGSSSLLKRGSLARRLSTWQEDFDNLVDIDTPNEDRQSLLRNLFDKSKEIREDIKRAIQSRDLSELAPGELKYGKDLKNLKTFKSQLRNDIIPEMVSKAPTTIPKIVNEVIKNGPSSIEMTTSTVEKIRELANDPSALQTAVDDITRELKNVVKSTPEGLEMPSYTIKYKTPEYEIREYSSYSVVSSNFKISPTVASSNDVPNDDDDDILMSGRSFNSLANYVLNGENSQNYEMSMTTPVIVDGETMSFVMPKGFNKDNAPEPMDDTLLIEDIESQLVAVREFSGLVTNTEQAKQRAALEDALLTAGIVFDNLSFRTLQYNPPYTIPWVRRNEVALTVLDIPEGLIIEEGTVEIEAVENVAETGAMSSSEDDDVDVPSDVEPEE